MKDDTFNDEPIYSARQHIYKGVAVGGPNDGRIMSSYNLTEFVTRKIERKAPDPNTLNLLGLSVQEIHQIQEIERALMKETLWAKQNPHRYDFDIDRQQWLYVEYILQPLEEEK